MVRTIVVLKQSLKPVWLNKEERDNEVIPSKVYVLIPYFFIFVSIYIGFFFLYYFDEGDLWIVTVKPYIIIGIEFRDMCFRGVELGLKLSIISLAYLIALRIIVACTRIFSICYIEGDLHRERITDLVFVFVLSMFTVVSAENVFTMVLGWEGLGVSSYALIIYYQDKSALNAGYLTAIRMRVGDLLFIILIRGVIGAGDFSLVRGLLGIGRVLAVCCITKRATIPFCAWLPAAIRAPTPVSALVHSSTLVTAGVCFLIRAYDCLQGRIGQSLLVFGSLVTIILAGSSALVENDLKKIVALSTIGQVRFMVFCIGVGRPMLAFFHMLTHAFIKAGIFIRVGILIQINEGEQDLREFDWAVTSKRPVAVGGLITGRLSLIGVPFLAGFYRKEAIVIYFNSCSYGICYYIMFYLGVVLTTGYTTRLIVRLGLKNKTKKSRSPKWPVYWWTNDGGHRDYVVAFLFIFFMFPGAPFWTRLIEGWNWFGVIMIGPEFVFKIIGLALMIGGVLGIKEEYQVWVAESQRWSYKKSRFFSRIWYFGPMRGQPWVCLFNRWTKKTTPHIEYWSDQIAGKGIWDIGLTWFRKFHRPVQSQDVFVPFFFIVLAVRVAVLLILYG